MTAQTLVSLIRSHGFEASVREDGQIRAGMVCSKDGESWVQFETVPASMVAVRRWLGY